MISKQCLLLSFGLGFLAGLLMVACYLINETSLLEQQLLRVQRQVESVRSDVSDLRSMLLEARLQVKQLRQDILADNNQ